MAYHQSCSIVIHVVGINIAENAKAVSVAGVDAAAAAAASAVIVVVVVAMLALLADAD